MSKSNTFENNLLALIFNGTPIPDLAENDSSSPLTQLWVALHTADPGEAGVGNTNEIAYTNYARISVIRTAAGWTVAGNTVNNTAQVTFPACGVTGGTATFGSITTAASGASPIYYSGALGSPLAISLNITPFFSATGITVTED